MVAILQRGDAGGVSAERLVLQLTLEPGEALAGSLAGDDTGEVMAFSGWFGLVEALEVLRQRTGQVGGLAPRDERPATDLGSTSEP